MLVILVSLSPLNIDFISPIRHLTQRKLEKGITVRKVICVILIFYHPSILLLCISLTWLEKFQKYKEEYRNRFYC